MSLLFMDGFDHYATADIAKKWTTTGSGGISAVGRRSGNGLSTGALTTEKSLASNEGTLIVGFAINPSGAINNTFFAFGDGSTAQLTFVFVGDGSIQVFRGTSAGTSLGFSTAGLFQVGVYHYVEIKAVFENAGSPGGSVVIRVDGVEVLNLAGIDTTNSTNAYANKILLGGASGVLANWDDLYVCNASGSTNNNFLGDVRIDTLFPNGEGNYLDFTCSTGTTHNTLVDETTPNTSDYNESSTVGAKDSYALGDLSAITSQTIYGIQVLGAILKDDAGARSIKVGVRTSSAGSPGSLAQAASAALSTSQLYYASIHETDPSTGIAWTGSGVNGAEAVFEIV